MTPAIADANDLVRAAVKMRRERQAAGKPVEEWYDVTMPVTEPMPEVAKAEEMQHVDEPYIEHLLHEHHLHRAGLTQDELDEALERLAGDGITHEQPTTSQRFLDLLDEMRRLHESKSADYGSETDPLANIRQGAEFVGIEPWRGCMVRIADKVQRLRTYCRTGRLVHEGVRDTLLDLSAYSLLAIVLFDEGLADG
jgi:hypothetical protein